MSSTNLSIIATSAFGLESIVQRELQQLGYDSTMLQPGRQCILAPPLAIARTNLQLRCAERILLEIGRFPAADFEQLFETTRTLPWEEWVGPHSEFPVSAKSVKSQLTSVPAIQRAVKRAVVDRLLSAHHVTELPEDGPRYAIEVALLKDQATLTIDTSGVGLHRRGYREKAGKAPLRETLAAAMVILSGWRSDMPLIDPFCGSGTIPIEAAMIGRRLAPGRNRTFVSESWPQLQQALWDDARTEADDQSLPDLGQRLLGNDINRRSLAVARENAQLAKVAEDVHFQQRPFDELTSSRKYGCLITNPPYGQRLDDRAITPLYRSFPLVLRRLPTWSHYILTSVESFEGIVGQSADKRRKLYNGRIACQLYQFHGPRPRRGSPNERDSANATDTDQVVRRNDAPTESDQPAATKANDAPAPSPSRATRRAFGGLREEAERQAREFSNRLKKRARHLRKWPKQGIPCFRLYERDIPEIPLVVDRYQDWLHIAEFSRPHERTVAEHADWLDLMKTSAAEALDVAPSQVALKVRRRQRGNDQYTRQQQSGHELIVAEQGLRFRVNLLDYLDTGLFLDHRKTRQMVREQSADKRVLNLFGYTGAFSVYAAAGSARSVCTVDLSANYLDWARQNFALNDLQGDFRFVRNDALRYVRDLHPDVSFDLAIVDPPTFSNSKSLENDWDVQQHYRRLLEGLAPHISAGGVVFFSTNFRRFKFDEAGLPYATIREISRQTVPEDFRNRRIHRCWRLQR